jgi:hypothetical protein
MSSFRGKRQVPLGVNDDYQAALNDCLNKQPQCLRNKIQLAWKY